jgi:hypothetical protein
LPLLLLLTVMPVVSSSEALFVLLLLLGMVCLQAQLLPGAFDECIQPLLLWPDPQAAQGPSYIGNFLGFKLAHPSRVQALQQQLQQRFIPAMHPGKRVECVCVLARLVGWEMQQQQLAEQKWQLVTAAGVLQQPLLLLLLLQGRATAAAAADCSSSARSASDPGPSSSSSSSSSSRVLQLARACGCYELCITQARC